MFRPWKKSTKSNVQNFPILFYKMAGRSLRVSSIQYTQKSPYAPASSQKCLSSVALINGTKGRSSSNQQYDMIHPPKGDHQAGMAHPKHQREITKLTTLIHNSPTKGRSPSRQQYDTTHPVNGDHQDSPSEGRPPRLTCQKITKQTAV